MFMIGLTRERLWGGSFHKSVRLCNKNILSVLRVNVCMVVCIFVCDREMSGHSDGRCWGVQLAATHCNTLQHTATHATPPPLIEGVRAIERERGNKYVYKWERNRWYSWSILKDKDRLKTSSWFDWMFVFAEKRKEVRSSFHGKEVAAPSHRRACAGVCAFLVVRVAFTKQVSWAPVHVQVCTLYRCFVYIHTHTHTAWGVLGCEPRGRDETHGEPEEPRWTKYLDVCTRVRIRVGWPPVDKNNVQCLWACMHPRK